MNRAEAIAELRQRAPDIRARGARALYLFGSTARDAAGESSDLDLFLDYDPTSRFNAFDLVGIKLLLEDALGARVDLTTRDGLHPRLREQIERSAVRVF
jgi:predicted nucleotidyltransferase